VRILTINCGSSTLKFELFEAAKGERSIARGLVDRIGGRGSLELISGSGERTVVRSIAANHGEATLQVIRLLGSSGLLGGLEAVGHRVVHGGARFSGPALLDTGAEDAIEELAELAPLHNGPALAAIHTAREALEPECLRWQPSTPPFTAGCPASPGSSRSPASSPMKASCATASTASPTST